MYTLPYSQQVWMLADCDSFFASCEIAHQASLRDKAVCVCNPWDIVLAANYHAKQYGVKTGTPTREAKKLLPANAAYIKPCFERYRTTSQKIFKFLGQYSKTLIPFSIDEAFGDITTTLLPYDSTSYQLYGQYIQKDIYQQTAIPISIGIGPTKIIAKILAKLSKPFGVCSALHQKEIQHIIGQLPITSIPFLGEKRKHRLWYRDTIQHFVNTPIKKIYNIMWSHGSRLRRELHGSHAMFFASRRYPHSISKNKSFHPNFTSDKNILLRKLLKNVDSVYHELIDKKCIFQWVEVWLKTKQFSKHSAHLRLAQNTDDKKILLETVQTLFNQSYQTQTQYRTTWITLTELKPKCYYPRSLDRENHTTKKH